MTARCTPLAEWPLRAGAIQPGGRITGSHPSGEPPCRSSSIRNAPMRRAVARSRPIPSTAPIIVASTSTKSVKAAAAAIPIAARCRRQPSESARGQTDSVREGHRCTFRSGRPEWQRVRKSCGSRPGATRGRAAQLPHRSRTTSSNSRRTPIGRTWCAFIRRLRDPGGFRRLRLRGKGAAPAKASVPLRPAPRVHLYCPDTCRRRQ